MRVFCFSLLLLTVLSAQAPAPKPPVAVNPSPAPLKKPATPSKPPATPPNPADKVVVTVGDETITAGEFQRLVDKFLPESARTTADGKRNLMDQLVKTKVLAQEARRRKIDQQPEI